MPRLCWTALWMTSWRPHCPIGWSADPSATSRKRPEGALGHMTSDSKSGGPLAGMDRAQRRRLREERRGTIQDTTVPSPCIAVCQMDTSNQHCIGCLRTVDEIREWPILTADEKRAVLAAIEERKNGA